MSESTTPPGRGLSWKVVLLVIVLALIGTGAWMYYRLETWPQRTAREVSRAFGELAGIQPRITVHDHVFMEQTSPVLELAVVTSETGVDHDFEHEWLGSRKHIRIRATYSIRAGFDLTQSFAVRLDDHQISAELPPAKILAIDPRDIEVLVLENGLWNKISPTDLESELRVLPDLARRKALAKGLAKDALDVFTKRLRDQLGHDYDINVRTSQPLD